MGKDLDGKTITLIIVIVVLVGAAGYLTYLISNNQNPLVLLNSRASEGETDPLLAQGAGTPTPTVSFTSTSPTPTPAVGANTTPQPSGTVTPSTSLSPTIIKTSTTPSPSTLPSTGGGAIYVTATPSPVGSLPVAGFGDFLRPAVIGGGILIIAALLL
ncbi:MAG: hypothetical protein NUW00_03685 [Candidatus Kaiserbacteria bacterium]|nr:hypothetical protein [Candidatus Kaiserbacteria bacterium]